MLKYYEKQRRLLNVFSHLNNSAFFKTFQNLWVNFFQKKNEIRHFSSVWKKR